jgi:hypothetical protein
MLFGAFYFLENAFAAGGTPDGLELAGRHPGPLDPMRLTASGRPEPERLLVFEGEESRVVLV